MSNRQEDILIVDDTPDNLRLLSTILRDRGYEVRKAVRGDMALRAVNAAVPDLILLDINLPGSSGYDICIELKKNPHTSNVPVIFISALDSVDDKVRAFEVGGADYISKPFHGEEIIARVEHQLSLRNALKLLTEQNLMLVKEIRDRQRSEMLLQQQTQQLQIALQELKRAQAQLVQNEKMVGLGELVAGIAHEINNPINFIYGNITPARDYINDLLALIEIYRSEYQHPTAKILEAMEDMDIDFAIEDLVKILESMHGGADRIRKIVASLKNFARLDEAPIKPVDLHEGLNNTLVMLRHRLQPGSRNSTSIESRNLPKVRVVRQYGKLPKVTCCASEINQVFMSLITNSIDAFHESFSRDLEKKQHSDSEDETSIQLPETPDQFPTIWIQTELAHNNMAIIRVIDNGPGIPDKIQDKMFNPFFTTKPVGKGTGLGLTIGYQIVVEKHGGQLRCRSAMGKGTEFTIEIPVDGKKC